MPITFEKTDKYDGLTDTQREIAEKHLIGQTYGSIGEALDAEHLHPNGLHGSFSVRHWGFYIGEVKVTPDDIPYILHEAPITARVVVGDSTHIITGLIAKVVE